MTGAGSISLAPAMDPTVRFDSLDPARGPRSFRFAGFRGVVRAGALADVLPALARVERAVADGLHAAGFVAYEAATAFDAALVARPPDPSLPLLWFALYETRIECPAFTEAPLTPTRQPEPAPRGNLVRAQGWAGEHPILSPAPAGEFLPFSPRDVSVDENASADGPARRDAGAASSGSADPVDPDDAIVPLDRGPLGAAPVAGSPGRFVPGDEHSRDDAGAFALGDLRADTGPDAYAEAVARIRELIAAGDTYQVNHTFRLHAPFTGAAPALYHRLCRAQRAAFCAYLDLGERTIVSASPELFFRWRDGEIELRPMKGTRPRGRWLEEDRAVARELAASPKDRAENLMIVDLLRNDAGRIAEFGGVRVERMFEVELYPTVHQMTSTIRARLRPEAGLTDVFRALFPCGSITGAPKVRTSRIIAELEGSPRGVYTGAIGFVSPGEAAFSVAIRTVVIDRKRGVAELGVGSGITYDSDAADEYRECLSKAAFVRREPPPALLETFGWTPDGGFVRGDAHLARLRDSAEYFGYPLDADALRRALETASAAFPREPRRVRIELSPDGRAAITHAEMPRWREPVRLAPARRTVPSDHPFWYHKTAHRAILAAHPPVAAAHDLVLLVNERGELAETPVANVVLEMDGERWTPHLDAGLLPGVLRAELLAAGAVRERVLTVADAERASRIWVINSLRGWGAAVLVDRSAVGSADGDSTIGTAAAAAVDEAPGSGEGDPTIGTSSSSYLP